MTFDAKAKILALLPADRRWLIKIRMRHILSVTRRSIAAVKSVFGQSDAASERLPGLRMITYLPEPVRENRRESRSISAGRSVEEPPPVPILNQDEPAQNILVPGKPDQHKPNRDKANDDDLELQRICEAIGLDVKEVTGEATPHAAVIPAAGRDFHPDLGNHVSNHDLSNHDLNNDVSADVLRLIEHVEATNTPKPGLHPGAGDAFERAVPPVRQTRARSTRAAHRESVQMPAASASDLADVLASLKLRLLKIRLAPDDMDEAQAEIATAIAQLHSPRPKPQIIALSLTTLISILEKAGPAALTKDIEASLTRLRDFRSQWDV